MIRRSAVTILWHKDCKKDFKAVWLMVGVVQLVERQIVVLVVVGSSPISHPMLYRAANSYADLPFFHDGPSPSGKATDFDSVIPLVRIQLAQPEIDKP